MDGVHRRQRSAEPHPRRLFRLVIGDHSRYVLARHAVEVRLCELSRNPEVTEHHCRTEDGQGGRAPVGACSCRAHGARDDQTA